MSVYYRQDRDAWVVSVTDEWERRHTKFVKSEVAAHALENQLKSSIATARSQLRRGELPDLKLSEGITLFLSQLAASPTTRSHNQQRLQALQRVIGDPRLQDVTPQMLASYQTRRVQRVSPATLAYEAQVIYRMFHTFRDDPSHCP